MIAEIKVSYVPNIKGKVAISTSEVAYQCFLLHFEAGTIGLQEQFKVMYLNRANMVIGIYHHTTGGVTATLTDVKLILGTAIKCVACGIIVCHNHPSGNLHPSRADEKLTHKLKQACELMDIQLLDHLIISNKGYYSFTDEGLI